jgi:hypothetical protein
MKTLLIFAFVLAAQLVNSQTQVSGGIYQNTTWSAAASPYLVTGSIVVFPGKSLTIEPGVELIIDNVSSSEIYIEARGIIDLIGTETNPIVIHTLYDTTNVGWQGFKCISSQGGQINADRFHIANAVNPFFYETPQNTIAYNNCRFSYCQQAVTVSENVTLSKCDFINNGNAAYGWANFNIDNCTFDGNASAVNAYTTNLSITNSTFSNNQTAIQFSSIVFGAMDIHDCNFTGNDIAVSNLNNGDLFNCYFSNNGTAILFAYEAEIYDNLFESNGLALDAAFSTSAYNNQITNNTVGVRISGLSASSEVPAIVNNQLCYNLNYNIENGTNVNVSLLSNCFCGLDSSSIELSIYDGYDDITRGLLNYSVYDSSCTSLLQSVIKFEEESSSLVNLDPANYQLVNPVIDNLYFIGVDEVSHVTIRNMLGQSMAEFGTGNNFSVWFLPSGAYFLECEMNQKTVQIKFLKQ